MISFKNFLLDESFDKPPKVEHLPREHSVYRSKNDEPSISKDFHNYHIHDGSEQPTKLEFTHDNISKESDVAFFTHDPEANAHTTDQLNIGPSHARKVFAGVHEAIKQHIKSGRIGDMKHLVFTSSKSSSGKMDSRSSLYNRFTQKYGGHRDDGESNYKFHTFKIPISNIKKHLGMES